MKKTYTLLTVLISFAFLSFNENDDLIQKIRQKIEKYYLEYPSEKAYLHLDKPYYSSGETVWIKAYLVEGATNYPDTISVPLYVDLINNENQEIINHYTIKLDKGFAGANIVLPENLKTGFYRLRAYTSWMRNFDESLMFNRDFKVFFGKEADAEQSFNAEEIDIQFFPEGGDLVNGIQSRVAFKAIDVLGLGLDVSGYVISSKGDTVCNFKSQHLGMGFFTMIPESDVSYKAIVKYRNDYTKTVDLPKTLENGAVISLDNVTSAANIKVGVQSSFKTATRQILVAQANGQVLFTAEVDLSKKNNVFAIPKAKLSGGVVMFTLFNEQALPIAERLAFVDPSNALDIKITPDKVSYKTREKVTLDVEVKDNKGEAIEGNFSVLVSDANQVKAFEHQESLQSYLLMSSDLKGNIEKPGMYFDKNVAGRKYLIDILMMCQGWRRFKWQQVLQDNLPPQNFYMEDGLAISGKLSKSKSKILEAPESLRLIYTPKDGDRMVLALKTPITGEFYFPTLDFTDTCDLYFKTEFNKEFISIDPITYPKYFNSKFPVSSVQVLSKEIENYLKLSKEELEMKRFSDADNAVSLDAVQVKAKKTPPPKDNRALMYNTPDATVDMAKIKYGGAFSIFDVIKGRVAGVVVSGDRDDPTVLIRGVKSMTQSQEPLYMIDGVRVNKQTVLALNLDEIEKVDVLKSLSSTVKFGAEGSNGVINVMTKSGNPNGAGSAVPDFLKMETRVGYNVFKEFYVPKYDQDLAANLRPDNRATVYWKAVLKTDKDGKAKVSYFNTDAETQMRVHVEGISSLGLLGDKRISYPVSR